jgi:hypothetical protein
MIKGLPIGAHASCRVSEMTTLIARKWAKQGAMATAWGGHEDPTWRATT